MLQVLRWVVFMDITSGALTRPVVAFRRTSVSNDLRHVYVFGYVFRPRDARVISVFWIVLPFDEREETVFTPDHRSTPRFKLQTSLIFTRRKPLPHCEQKTRTINISSTGVCFATDLDVSVGEVIDVVLVIPKRVTGLAAVIRKFAGRITHVDRNHDALGHSHVGVHLLYCEAFCSLKVTE